MSDNKAEYRRFIQDRTDIPVFFQDWWLDVVSGNSPWKAVLVKDKAGNVQLIMPFIPSYKFGIQNITQPVLTPYLGIKIFYPDEKMKIANRYRFEKKVLTAWSESLHRQKWWFFNQLFPADYYPLLPLYNLGFSYTIYYRSVLENIQNLDATFKGFHENRKYDIKKFDRSGGIIEKTEEVGLIYELIKQSFSFRNSKIPYSKQLYLKLDQQLRLKSHRLLLLAKNERNELLAGVYIIIDFDRAYLWSTGRSKQSKDSTATAALIWEGIQYTAKFVNTFDFCGSMIPSISKFFQGFGGTLEPYPKVFKHRYRWTNLIFTLLNK